MVILLGFGPGDGGSTPLGTILTNFFYEIFYGKATAYWNKYTTNYSDTNNWITSGMQYYLHKEKDENGTPAVGYLGLLINNAKKLISPTTYYLGNVDYKVDTVKNVYIQERGTIECESTVSSSTHTKNCNIWYGNENAWNGLIALIYPSDYGYSASDIYWETDMYGWGDVENDGIIASSTSWFHQTANHAAYEFILSPNSYNLVNASTLTKKGALQYNAVYMSSRVRPTLYLKSDTRILDAEGTELNPYVVVFD